MIIDNEKLMKHFLFGDKYLDPNVPSYFSIKHCKLVAGDWKQNLTRFTIVSSSIRQNRCTKLDAYYVISVDNASHKTKS